MTLSEFDLTTKKLLSRCEAIRDAKRPEYTASSLDVLLNFKETATYLSVSPNVCWGTYFLKGIKSIIVLMAQAFSGKAIKSAEPTIDRFADAVNYLLLGWALFVEATHSKEEGFTLVPAAAGAADVEPQIELSDVDRHRIQGHLNMADRR